MNNTVPFGPTGLPVITSTITIGSDSSFQTVERNPSGPEFRIFAVGETGNLTLNGTTVSGGVASSGDGGGILNFGTLCLCSGFILGNSAQIGGGVQNSGSLTLRSSVVQGNTAAFSGGGISSIDSDGPLTLNGTVVSGNTASSFGGGIFSGDPLTLTYSTVSSNTTGYAGGGIAAGGPLTVTDSTVSGNSVSVGGGGIAFFGRLATATLTNSTVSGNSAAGDRAGDGGGISISGGTLTLTNSTVEGNSAQSGGGGIFNARGFAYQGTHYANVLALTNSTVSSNTAGTSGGGVDNNDLLTLSNSTVSGNTTGDRGGGIDNTGTVTLTNSTVSGNTAGTSGGGVSNDDLLTLSNSTISGNTAADHGGGVDNSGTATLTNSTVSGNTGAARGGGIDNTGTVTFTNGTVSRNASGRVAGGLFNTGAVTLIQSLLTGNTAPVIGPEAYSVLGNVIGDGFNVFGHDSFSGVAGFTLGATDLVPAVPLSAILDATLSYNGGPTRTHGLVFGSPAVDTIPGVACVTGTDQRGAPRPQDADGDTFADCDSGAVERGLIPIQAEITNTTLDCNSTACRVSVRCNLRETECTNPIDIAVRTRAPRASDGTLVKASKLIRFAAGATNVPPGGTQQLRVKLTKPGKRLVRATTKRRLKGVLGIREIAATVSNTPITISRTNVTIRLKRR